jgi:hypothetical protein
MSGKVHTVVCTVWIRRCNQGRVFDWTRSGDDLVAWRAKQSGGQSEVSFEELGGLEVTWGCKLSEQISAVPNPQTLNFTLTSF